MAEKVDGQNLDAALFELLPATEKQQAAINLRPSVGFFQDAWRRLRKNKAAVCAGLFLILLMAVAVLSIWFSPHDPTLANGKYANLPPRIAGVQVNGFNGTKVVKGQRVDVYQEMDVPDNVNFYLGTDDLGRDLFSRLLMGLRYSLLIALMAALFDILFGVSYGLISGLVGGKIDTLMQRFLEILSGVPNLVVMILVLTVLKPGVSSIIVAMIITGWINMARVVRAVTISLKNQDFIIAAKTLGQSKTTIALRHILPNISSVIIVQLMFTIPNAIFFEAFLSFIGIGLTAPNTSLGILLNEGYKVIRYAPNMILAPAVLLSLTMISFNLLADGLRDAFDPKMKEG